MFSLFLAVRCLHCSLLALRTGLTYWSCAEALDSLSTSILVSRGLQPTETGKLKNFFGSYTDPPLKALAALIALYRKSNLHLAEGARLMSQAVTYDVPQLRKQIQSSAKQIEDLGRKIGEESRSARELQSRALAQLKQQWGVAYFADAATLSKQIKKRAEEDVPQLINDVMQATKE